MQNLNEMKLPQLREIAKDKNIKNFNKYKKNELIEILQSLETNESDSAEGFLENEVVSNEVVSNEMISNEITPSEMISSGESTSESEKEDVDGILELAPTGFGFLRFDNYQTSDKDVYVPPIQIKRFGLKTGDRINGIARPSRNGEKFRALLYINSVNGMNPIDARKRPKFEDLTPTYPTEKIKLENSQLLDSNRINRIIDLFIPIGKGQRGLIVAPPKAGKTILLQKIAVSIRKNYPDIELIVLLIDERPEEVTEMKRVIDADVIYSTFDELPENHIKVAEIVLERAKALVEMGKDVVILMDSITRLARAYNLSIPSSGRTLSGGLDPASLHPPKRFLGAARNTDEAGSLTILATALIETGSRMDDVIFEEFKSTGNMEIILSRKLTEKRIFPAIDIERSGTRREDLLLDQKELETVWNLRRAYSKSSTQDVIENIMENMIKTRSNAEFIEVMNKNALLK